MYGFIKVCAVTPDIKVADVRHNADEIIKNIRACGDAQLIVFPELCVSGYTCGDLFNQSALLQSVEGGIARICASTEGKGALVFVGAPLVSDGRLYNCAVAMSRGRILGVVPKTHLPSYGEF